MKDVREPAVRPYLERLESLPFVDRVALVHPATGAIAGVDDPGLALRVTTRKRRYDFVVEIKRIPRVNRAVVQTLLDRIRRVPAVRRILFAPHVTDPMGKRLADAGIDYVDLAGNLRLALGKRYFAQMSGHRPSRRIEGGRALSGVGLRVIFALLARPELAAATARELAARAGVGKSAAAEVLQRLGDERQLVGSAKARRLDGLEGLFDQWLVGYSQVLRPRLLLGRYDVPHRDPFALEDHIESTCRNEPGWAWGGAAAAYRLTQSHRGADTTVHVVEPSSDLPRRLEAHAARDGKLTLLGLPGPIALEGERPRTAHPLLVYTELVTTGRGRDREAVIAADIRERLLPWTL